MRVLLSALLLVSAASFSVDQPISSTTEQRGTDHAEVTSKPMPVVRAQSYSTDVWFQRIELELSGDHNANGFYHQLYLRFDADTNRSSKAVWAEFSLNRAGRPEQLLHISSIFTLYRQSRNDWFAIDTLLEENYPTDYYDLTIRLYDASTGWLLAEISGYDEVILADLPLEDYRRDQQVVTVVESYGGSLGILALLGLSLLLWRRQAIRHQ